MTERRGNALALVAWTAILVVALACLHALGRGPLSAPPTSGIGPWLAVRDAETATFALLRVALLGSGWYLLASTLLATALRGLRADAAARVVEACAPAPVRRLVRSAGLSIAASVVAVSAAAASEADAPVTMRRLPDAVTRAVDAEPTTVTMTRLPDADELTTTTTKSETSMTAPTWTVAAGDHLWSIARRTLSAAWRIEPTDDEVDPYWRQLIEENRSRLPDPNNADLIVPDLVLALPAPPTR